MPRVTFKKGAKIQRIEKNLKSLRTALTQVGVIMVAESQRAFRDQSFGGKKWPARAAINVFGIIADFAAGKKKPPSRRFEKRPALMDTGALARSIAFRLSGTNAVIVGTQLKYAGAHQYGGKVESEKLTPAVRKALWSWLKRQTRDLRQKLGWLLNKKFKGKSLKGTVPARPFLGVTRETKRVVKKLVGVTIMEAKR